MDKGSVQDPHRARHLVSLGQVTLRYVHMQLQLQIQLLILTQFSRYHSSLQVRVSQPFIDVKRSSFLEQVSTKVMGEIDTR